MSPQPIPVIPADPDDVSPIPMKPHSLEILDRDSGLFVSLTAGGSGAILVGTRVIAAAPIPDGGLEGLDAGPLELEVKDGRLSAEIEAAGEPIVFDGGLAGRRESRPIRVKGRLEEGDGSIGFDCAGVLHLRQPARPGHRMRLSREVTVALDDGGLLCASLKRPDGCGDHGEEIAAAAISHPGGYIEFERVLLSTTYDRAGRHQRATLELWPASEDIAALHGSGRAIAGCTAKVAGDRVDTALFTWSLDGHTGLGRYEIRSATASATEDTAV